MGRERSSEFYDERAHKYDKKQASITYGPIYKKIVDIFDKEVSKDEVIYELGCGVGNLAKMLKNIGFKNYIGIDFSKEMIRRAEEKSHGYKFIVGNLIDEEIKDIYRKGKYFILMEVLEHINNDKEILSEIPSKSFVVVTLPSYSAKGHVRYFKKITEIRKRYKSLLDFENGEMFAIMNGKGKGKNIFIFKGRKL